MHNLMSRISSRLIYTIIFLVGCCCAAPTFEPGVMYLDDKAIALDDGYRLSIQGVLGGIVLLVIALLLWFRSLWDTTLAGNYVQGMVGFITMGFVTWVMLANFEPAGTYGTNRLTIYFIVPLIVGTITSLLMARTLHLYIMLLGGLGGLALGLWVLGWKTNLSVTSSYGRAILLTVLVVVFMLLAPAHPHIHKLGTALSASYILFMGLDIFFHTGFLYIFTATMDNNSNHDEHFTTQRGTYIMQATLIVSFVVAYVCQGIDFKHRVHSQHTFMMSLYYNPEYREKVTWDKYLYSTFMPWFNRGQPVAAAPTVAV